MSLDALVKFVAPWRRSQPSGTKDELVKALMAEYSLVQKGALLVGSAFVVRVSQNSSDSGFPNAVVAFKKIVVHDDLPIVVCLLTPNRCALSLANTTFIRKVTHSSHGLTHGKLVGSILGSDILATYEGIANEPSNFATLWAKHKAADRSCEIERIVDATQAIVGAATTWTLSPDEQERVLAAPELARTIGATKEYRHFATSLHHAVQAKHKEIVAAAAIVNNKVRGDCIEAIVTGVVKNQGLGDMTVTVLAASVSIDVKSKRLDLSSSPKAYNIDKVLKALGEGNRLLAILFVGVDPARDTLRTRLISIFDSRLIDAVRIDARWSGRGTRGTAQFSGSLDALWDLGFVESIDIPKAKGYLSRLIAFSDMSRAK